MQKVKNEYPCRLKDGFGGLSSVVIRVKQVEDVQMARDAGYTPQNKVLRFPNEVVGRRLVN